tara:strand:- start:492 stop:1469 length:978 start_codon:yes stop_codon:yes gene_type:complete
MKKLLLILLCLPFIGFGQSDILIFSSGDTIYAKVIEVGVNDITYQYKGETTNNVIKKREVAKVIYSSGRIETFKGLQVLESKIEFLKRKEKNENSFEIGVVFGSTSSNTISDWDLQNGFNVTSMQRKNGGLMLQYNISDLLSVNSKLLYQVKGWHLKGDNIIITTPELELPDGGLRSFDIDQSVYNHYISLPILMQINSGNKIRGTINTGFYTSYLLDVIEIIEQSYIDTTIRVVLGDNIIVEEQDKNKGNPQRTDTDPIDGYNRLDFGLVLGVGVSYIINDKIRLSFESNLEYGLINKYKEDYSFYAHYNIAYNFLFGCSYILH